MIDLPYLDTQKSNLLSMVQGWTPQRLSDRPFPGGWSAAQVFDHLVKTEEGILEAAKEGLQSPHRIGLSDRVRTVFLQKVFESDRRVKVPASATVVMPDDGPEFAVICQRWDAVRIELAAFRSQLSEPQMRQGIFRHPVGGWMALPDVVNFFSVHIRHHTFQLERLSAGTRSL